MNRGATRTGVAQADSRSTASTAGGAARTSTATAQLMERLLSSKLGHLMMRHGSRHLSTFGVPKSFRGFNSRRATQAPGNPDPPPLKWSALRYGFRAKEDHDAEEETQARGDCCEAAPGGMCWCRRGRALPTRYVTRSTSSLSGGLRGTDLLRPGSPGHARAGQRMKGDIDAQDDIDGRRISLVSLDGTRSGPRP